MQNLTIITPEYQHSIPAVLKNASGGIFPASAFLGKPGAPVGSSTGIRAIEHLAHVAAEAEGAGK